MLNALYNDKITVKFTTGNVYRGVSATESTINGALIEKTRRKIDAKGNEVVTEMELHTDVNLPLGTLIVHNSAERPTLWVTAPKNHLLGTGVDHYEYGF